MARSLKTGLEDADQTGFMHGTRQLIKSIKAGWFTYRDKAGKASLGRETGKPIPPTPAILVEFMNPTTKAVSSQKYGNGDAKSRTPKKDGTGFEAPEGSTAKGALAKGSEAYKLLASMVPLWPEKRRAALLDDYTTAAGALVEIVALPVGKASTLPNAPDQKTIPVVGAVVKYPWGANPNYGQEGGEEPEPEEAEEPEDEDEALDKKFPKKSKKEESEEDESESESDPITEQAREVVASIILSKQYKKKGISLDDLGEAAGEQLEGVKGAPKVLKALQDEKFLKAGAKDGLWDYDDEEQIVKAAE